MEHRDHGMEHRDHGMEHLDHGIGVWGRRMWARDHAHNLCRGPDAGAEVSRVVACEGQAGTIGEIKVSVESSGEGASCVIEGMYRIVLFCKDTEASKEWYTRAGFSYLHGYDGMHWFRAGDCEIMLHPAGEAPVVVGEVSLHVRVADVEAAFQSVVAEGLQPTDHQAHGAVLTQPVRRPWGEVEFELSDLDGYRWAFTQPASHNG